MDRQNIIDIGETLYMKNEKLKHQGYRNDQREAVEASLEILAKQYGKSKRTISRYIRVHYFSHSLKECYLRGMVDFKAAIELSYLPVLMQDKVCINTEHIISLEDAVKIRRKVNSGNKEELQCILGNSKERRRFIQESYLFDKYNLEGYSNSDLLYLLDKALFHYLVSDKKVRWY